MRKRILILSSLVGIVVLVSLVAVGTYAVFTDNVVSDEQEFTAGTVDIVVNEDEDDVFETEVHMVNMEPGDCATPQPINIHNAGTLPVHYRTWIYPRGDIFGCDPNPDCNMKVSHGDPTGSDPLWKLEPDPEVMGGETESLMLSACLPLCAGNNCQGKDGYFRMFVHAWQQSHLEGYECIKLEDKSAETDWMPDPTTPAHGNLCFKVVDHEEDGCANELHMVVNGYGLAENACFQLDLTGGDMDDPHDGACTAQDAALAGMPGDAYISGYWNWGDYLEADCDDEKGGEGVWNYAGVYDGEQDQVKVCSDDSKAISYEGYLSGLPAGDYVVKAHVKEISNWWPGDDWTEVLAEMDYLRFTIPDCTP